MNEDELVEQALPVLPEIGKLLYAAVSRHPKAAGLSLGQIKTMSHLYHHGCCTVGEVAAGLGVSMPSASELLDRLVDCGMVERGVNPNDRRQVLVWLTPEAEQFGTELRALRRAQVRAALDRLEPAERPVFLKSLQALAAVLREDAEQLPACPESPHLKPRT